MEPIPDENAIGCENLESIDRMDRAGSYFGGSDSSLAVSCIVESTSLIDETNHSGNASKTY